MADAKRERLDATAALALVGEMHHLYVAKGHKVVHVDLRREKPERDALLKLLLGPSGNLRAPTIRVGKTLVVGFEAEMYGKILAKS
jgi:arsenate reductase-like glutaredoxin family protein